MIATLYEPFRHWSENGSVYILSDTHFGDADCKTIDHATEKKAERQWIKKEAYT